MFEMSVIFFSGPLKVSQPAPEHRTPRRYPQVPSLFIVNVQLTTLHPKMQQKCLCFIQSQRFLTGLAPAPFLYLPGSACDPPPVSSFDANELRNHRSAEHLSTRVRVLPGMSANLWLKWTLKLFYRLGVRRP